MVNLSCVKVEGNSNLVPLNFERALGCVREELGRQCSVVFALVLVHSPWLYPPSYASVGGVLQVPLLPCLLDCRD